MKFINQARAKTLTILSYLGSMNQNAKMIKNSIVSNNYTYGINLSPAQTSCYNVCPYSTPECRLGCLHGSGRVKVENYSGKRIIQDARIKKTKLFFEHREFFMEWLIAEMKCKQAKAKKDGFYFSARLNVTSDIEWETILHNGQTIFEIFPDVQFYDYAKNWNRLNDDLPSNYHLTLSYTGKNKKQCVDLLAKGYNVAVVYNVSDVNDLPSTWNGYPVINGDLTDYRPSDPKGSVVGLKWKHIADKEIDEQIRNSIFVEQVNSAVTV
jgi:hypothetical protein